MLPYRFLLFCWAIGISGAWAQVTNLVPNGSFEEYHKCPSALGISMIWWVGSQKGTATHWFCPNYGTPDHFHECNDGGGPTVPSEYFGWQKPKDGKGYAGIILLLSDDTTINDYMTREYLAVQLRQPLEAGKQYCVSAYASPVDEASTLRADMLGTAAVGVYLTKDSLYEPNPGKRILPGKPQFLVSEVMRDTGRWYHIGGIYTAEGGEEWLTIGNFFNDTHTDNLYLIEQGEPESPYQFFAYTFIDDVWVYEINSVHGLPPSPHAVCTPHLPVQLPATIPFERYQWSTGETGPTATIAAPGIYWLEADWRGCPLHDTVEIRGTDPPVVDIGPDQISNCQDGVLQPVVLKNAVPLEHYSWLPYSATPELTALEPRLYTLTTHHVCGTFTDEVRLTGCETALYVPNAFAPEGEQEENRRFSIQALAQGSGLVSFIQMDIYDRFGTLLYSESPPERGWDGTWKGRACAPGVYMWLLRYRSKNGETEMKYGNVTLIR